MYTHKFEIEMDGVKLEGEIDFTNPNDGIKFTDISEDTELHINTLKKVIYSLQQCKEVDKCESLIKFIIELKD